jgi:aspartate/methionine/tyrosine aminotransferase
MSGIERTLIRQVFDSAPPDAINLGLGQPDLPTPALASLAGTAGIAAGKTGYTSTAGDMALRAAIAESYRPFASKPEEAVVTVGSQEAMFAACLTLVDAGREILYPDPGYPAYPVVARLIGARPVSYPLRPERRFRLDPRDVEERLTDRTALVILLAPSNPTGACIDREDLRVLVEQLENRGIPWVSDEIYAGFTYEDRFVSPMEFSNGGGLVISGLSKDMSMTGWRIGWVVGPERIIARIIAAHQYLVTCAPSISQCAALAAFSPDGAVERARYLDIFRRRREIMAEELSLIPDLRFSLPEGAFYFFVEVSAYGESLEIGKRILENRKVVTIPGEAFGKNGAGFLRISFAAPDETIREGVGRIAEELKAIRG